MQANFKVDKVLYAQYKALADANNRSMTGQWISDMEKAIAEYKKEHGVDKIPVKKIKKVK